MLIVAGIIQIDPAHSAAGQAALEIMRAATLTEPGCLEYQAYADRNDSSVFFMFERWESQAALLSHFASDHMADFGRALGALGVRAMDVKKYEVSSVGSVP